MIISASRRTDIPAFFGDWFMERVRAGHVRWTNPFNSAQTKDVSLKPSDVDALVFFSKNPEPFLDHLDELDFMGYRYYFQFTLNDYPDVFEPRVPPLEERVDTFKRLAVRIGSDKVIWRFDPIIVSSVTPIQYHVDRVGRLAERLEGYTQRLVISFVDFYGKANRRMERLRTSEGIVFRDIAAHENRAELLTLAGAVSDIAGRHGLTPVTCAEKVELESAGIRRGACVDGELIRRVLGVQVPAEKDKGQRKECLCVKSLDIGTYHTCKHGCVYCYAT